jgi:hypothetical protein
MDDFMEMRPVTPVPERPSTQRRFVDLRMWRILPALIVAPMLGAALMAWGLCVMNEVFAEDGDRMSTSTVAMLFFSPSLWSVISGLAYLWTITRTRGTIARVECFLLGCWSGFLAPMCIGIGDRLLRGLASDMDWLEIGFFSLAGLIALPFGLLGGWLFWHLAIRPSIERAMDYAPVFD